MSSDIAPKLLVITFNSKKSVKDIQNNQNDTKEHFAKPLVEFPGLKWKIFLADPVQNKLGGIYMWEDDSAVKKFLESDFVKRLKESPDFSNFDVHVYDTLAECSKVTRAPIFM
eukprot:GEZU01023551.1.p1 GENE.GEZU01023551.1~~GEZU01023551.1.p1  ORF type:complete len:113 (-),score=35.59 GEZU01023551.1:89-427(-)